MPAFLTNLSNLDIPSISLTLIFVTEIIVGAFLLFVWIKVIKISKTFTQLSQKTFSQLQTVHDQAEKLDESMIDVAKKEIKEYLEELPNLSEQFTKRHQETLAQLTRQESKALQEEQQTLADQLLTETQSSLARFDTKLDDILVQIKQELQQNLSAPLEEKSQQLQQLKRVMVEQQVNQIAQEIANRVLHRSLNPEEHHQFVLEQIKRAEEEGVFA